VAASATTGAAATSSSAAAVPTGGSDQTAGAPLSSDATQPTSGQTVATDTPVAATTSTSTSTTVPVVVTYSGWNASLKQAIAGGYVNGVIESGGTCTLTLSKAGVQVTAQGQARPDAATTACGGLTVPGAKLGAGTWKAVLSYTSATSTGSSTPVEIAVTP
jgi:hypothetical protein